MADSVSDGLSIHTNAAEVAAFFDQRADELRPRSVALVRHWGVRLLAAVKAHAAGRPGPRMVTGDYNRSWTLDVSTQGSPTARAGTNRPQGRKLELGWHGIDSLGRHSDQPPYPHAGPGYDDVAPGFEEAAANLIGDVLTGG